MATKLIKLSTIHAFIAHNYSRVIETWTDLFKADKPREGAEEKGTAWSRDLLHMAVSFAENGWKESAEPLGATPIDKKMATEALSERKKLHAQLTSVKNGFEVKVGDETVSVTVHHIQKAVEVTYPVGKASDLDLDLVFGFRRYHAIILGNAVRIARGQEPITEVMVSVTAYASEADRRFACVFENTGKFDGVRTLSKPDMVAAARNLFERGVLEAQFRKAWKAGTGQKLYALCRLDQTHEDLKIVDKIVSGDLSFDPLDKEEMRKLAADPDTTSEDVQAYLDSPKKGGNDSKMASKKDIQGLQQHGVELVRMVATAIIRNDIRALDVLLSKKAAINEGVRKGFGKKLPLKATEEASEEESEETETRKGGKRASKAEAASA